VKSAPQRVIVAPAKALGMHTFLSAHPWRQQSEFVDAGFEGYGAGRVARMDIRSSGRAELPATLPKPSYAADEGSVAAVSCCIACAARRECRARRR
jgi:hypothetical protein